MKQIQYKYFSLKFHQKRRGPSQPNVCQFEITFACPIHCQHCYTDCYNNLEELERELTAEEIIHILEKVYDSGVLWLCLTGGDPLAREDFFKIYSYAKRKGFIITIFSSGIMITEEMADYFKQHTPFCIELTLNGITKETYEAISGVKGSYEKAMSAIFRLKKRQIPFKLKTLLTKQNIHEVGRIISFVENISQKFRPSFILHARLNQDIAPCSLRIKPEKILSIQRKFNISSMYEEETLDFMNCRTQANNRLFRCAAGTDSFFVDPHGNMFLCSSLREPSVNLLKDEISEGFELFSRVKSKYFETDSKCKTCSIWRLCHRCPGRAYLETNNIEEPVEYYCDLAHLISKDKDE